MTRAHCLIAGALLLTACARREDTAPRAEPASPPPPAEAREGAADPSGEVNPRLLRRFQPLPATLAADGAEPPAARVALGRHLFFDRRLSRDGDLACSSCHALDRYGVDGERTSAGARGQRGARNAPSVYNAAGHFAQFWDGRAADVDEQAGAPMLNPREMAMADGAAVTAALRSIPGYAPAFAAAFPGQPEPVSFENATRALGAFERKLVTPGRWDRYLGGDKGALTATEKAGLKTFLNAGCMVCHTGPYLGGSMFERVGVVEPWPSQADPGRFGVTGAEADRMMFKVPSLRNVEKTAPYFHDGSAETLDDAVRAMGKHQLGLDLAADEVASIVSWLKSLTGEIPGALAIAPTPL
jgi:cytochrome c peroxidase